MKSNWSSYKRNLEIFKSGVNKIKKYMYWLNKHDCSARLCLSTPKLTELFEVFLLPLSQNYLALADKIIKPKFWRVLYSNIKKWLHF